MNERIRELLKQAGGISYNDDNEEMSPMLVGSDVSKFVNLIVGECIGLCNQWPDTVRQVLSRQIKQHFGVEE